MREQNQFIAESGTAISRFVIAQQKHHHEPFGNRFGGLVGVQDRRVPGVSVYEEGGYLITSRYDRIYRCRPIYSGESKPVPRLYFAARYFQFVFVHKVVRRPWSWHSFTPKDMEGTKGKTEVKRGERTKRGGRGWYRGRGNSRKRRNTLE